MVMTVPGSTLGTTKVVDKEMRDTIKCRHLYTTFLLFFYHSLMFSPHCPFVSFFSFFWWGNCTISLFQPPFILFFYFLFYNLKKKKNLLWALNSLGFFSFLFVANISLFLPFCSLSGGFIQKLSFSLNPSFSFSPFYTLFPLAVFLCPSK